MNITAEQCVPEQCLPFPESYPRFTVRHVHILGNDWYVDFTEEVVRDVRQHWLAGECQRLDLIVADGAGHRFGTTWKGGKWSPALVPFIYGDTWVDHTVQP